MAALVFLKYQVTMYKSGHAKTTGRKRRIVSRNIFIKLYIAASYFPSLPAFVMIQTVAAQYCCLSLSQRPVLSSSIFRRLKAAISPSCIPCAGTNKTSYAKI